MKLRDEIALRLYSVAGKGTTTPNSLPEVWYDMADEVIRQMWWAAKHVYIVPGGPPGENMLALRELTLAPENYSA